VLIEVAELSHVYAPGMPLEREALRNINLRIMPGESVGIIGQTGSGKSTLVQHLAGLMEPTAGQVLLDGIAAHRRTTAARAKRRQVGIAFQSPEEQIFERTVFREVGFGPRKLGLRPPEIAARVNQALTMVGLNPDDVVDRSPFTLSGGEMRRLALASTLAMHPEVLILDEPTAGLDPGGRNQLLDRFKAWHHEMQLTLIVVSHDLTALAQLVDRAIVLQNGEIGDDGPIRQVLSHAQRLRRAGLSPPPSVALLRQLQRTGWPVRSDRLLPVEAAAAIASAHLQKRTTGSEKERP
jgi:energy-coupling factor transport system ATP-binding protein